MARVTEQSVAVMMFLGVAMIHGHVNSACAQKTDGVCKLKRLAIYQADCVAETPDAIVEGLTLTSWPSGIVLDEVQFGTSSNDNLHQDNGSMENVRFDIAIHVGRTDETRTINLLTANTVLF